MSAGYRFVNSLPKEELQRRQQPREEDLRGRYFRDTTAIIHSNPFRRLKHKTQVFFSPRNDHICTRIEHVMHVASVAASACRGLDLDADLAWAIGLGHDLGHTPFGHVGESIMADIQKDRGGFIHELYSLRVVDHLIHYGKGLNLTYAVRDGIVSHCGEKFEQAIRPDERIKELNLLQDREHYPATWEGAVVRMADKIAYLGRDLEDALQLKIVHQEELPDFAMTVLGRENGAIINTLVTDLIDTSRKEGSIGFSDQKYRAMVELKEFNYRRIYSNPLLADYHRHFERILNTLHTYLEELFSLYQLDEEKYRGEKNLLAVRFGDYVRKMAPFYRDHDGGFHRMCADYLAGMTDDYALSCIQEIMIPKKMENQFDQFLLGN